MRLARKTSQALLVLAASTTLGCASCTSTSEEELYESGGRGPAMDAIDESEGWADEDSNR